MRTSSRNDIGDDDDLDITGALTLSAWVRVDGTEAAYKGVVSKWAAGQRSYLLEVKEDTGSCAFCVTADGADAVWVVADSAAPQGVWVHVAGVYDPSEESMAIYVNGVLADDTPGSGDVPASLHNGSAAVRIGRHDADKDLEGAIDDARIYSRALSAEEVAVLAGGNSAYDGLNRRIVHAERKGKGTGSLSVTASHQPARPEERESCLSPFPPVRNYISNPYMGIYGRVKDTRYVWI